MNGPTPTKIEESLTTQRRYDRQAALFDLMEIPLELLALGRLRRQSPTPKCP